MDVRSIILIIVESIAVIVWGLVIGWEIGDARKRRKRKKLAAQGGVITAKPPFGRGTRDYCYICMDYKCPLPVSRDEYYGATAKEETRLRLKRNRTW